jgi:hypothetical protein
MPRKLDLSDAQVLAKQRGGECLATVYVNAHTPMPWRCFEKHGWHTTLNSVKYKNAWCPQCSIARISKSRMLTIEDMQKLAKERDSGGWFVSHEYLGFNELHRWRCSQEHEWEASPNNIKTKKSWCPHCSGNARKTLTDMQRLAANRDGKCLSTSYRNSGTKLEWKCGNNHQWYASPGSIASGSWCPECSTGLGERICRIIFETIFKAKFQRVRPEWLIDSSGARLELDGYNESLKLAFEHQGEQHYNIRGYRNKDIAEDAFAIQIQRDQFKTNKCAELGITLIPIPEVGSRLKADDALHYILDELAQRGIVQPSHFNVTQVDLKPAYCPQLLKEYQDIAILRGGRLVSEAYININTQLIWECGNKHQWRATPSKIKHAGSWCPTCAGRNKTIEALKTAAAKRGGKCLSSIYVDMFSLYRFVCAEGHEWEASANNVLNNSTWCRICSGYKKKTITDMFQLAKSKGGECLSNEYVSAHSKLKWRCKEQHTWEATPNSIARGRWCAACSGRKKKTFIDMHQLATNLKLICLLPKTSEYISAKQKIKWKCSKGHTFERCYDKLKIRANCPHCLT